MAITAGGSLNSVPAPRAVALESNYLDFNQDMGWAQQYLPDLMEKEAEVFGPRTISGFLSQVGAEESMSADQVIWSEQGRLHLSYKAKCVTAATGLVEIEADIVLKGTRVDGVYDSDPEKVKEAKKYSELSFSEAYEKNLNIMDMTAFTLCKENNLPINIFNINKDLSDSLILVNFSHFIKDSIKYII